MTIRTDIHRPSAIVPADYSFIACDSLYSNAMDVPFIRAQRAVITAHQARTGGAWSNHEHGGTCHVCGAAAMYLAVYHHTPTNTYIQTGEDCADKMSLGQPAAFRCIREEVKRDREAQAGKRKAQEVLAAADLSAAWTVYTTPHAPAYEENTISDIVGKLVRYGSVSDKQLAFVRRLLAAIPERAVKVAARAVEQAAAAPVPVTDARIVIEGEVLSKKVVEGRFGSVLKMLVKTDAGTKLWGTVPAAISPEKGDRVKLVAKVEPSKDDPKFGFFSRPAQAVIVTASLPVAA
jgi:hypothetical protein